MCFRIVIDVVVHFDFASFIPKIAVAKNHDKFDRKLLRSKLPWPKAGLPLHVCYEI